MGDILRVVRERKLDAALVIGEWPVPAENLAALVRLIDDAKISGKIAKGVFESMLESGDSPDAIVAKQGLSQISDESAVLAAVEEVLSKNADKVSEYRGGKEKLFGFFVGQVMKVTQGKANPTTVNDLLKSKLNE
jgi:aspartyl-tRNA(Asn)/glutamyl-tRNA(Gln) amidotransferase subunit B